MSRQPQQVEYNSDSRAFLEELNSSDKTSEPLLAREKAALIANSNTESRLRSQASGYLSRSSQELVGQTRLSLSDNNEQRVSIGSITQAAAVDSSSDSAKIVKRSSEHLEEEKTDSDYCSCSCNLKKNFTSSASRGRTSVTRRSSSSIMSKSSQLTLACFLAELVGTFLLVVSIKLVVHPKESENLLKYLVS